MIKRNNKGNWLRRLLVTIRIADPYGEKTNRILVVLILLEIILVGLIWQKWILN